MYALALDHAARVNQSLSLHIGRVRLFAGGKVAELKALSIQCYRCAPSAVAPIPVHSEKPRRGVAARRPCVLGIDSIGDNAELTDSVVIPNPMNMVNQTIRQFSVHVEPREAMGSDQPVINADNDVPSSGIASCNASFRSLHTGIYKPCKHARLRIVIQDFAKTLRGKIGLSHDALQLLIGQRLRRVDARPGLRYFSAS